MKHAGNLNPFIDTGESTITVSSTALNLMDDFTTFGFTLNQVMSADVVHIKVYDSAIRYRYTGNDATATSGYSVGANAELELVGKHIIRKFSMIAESADAEVYITLLTFGIPPNA